MTRNIMDVLRGASEPLSVMQIVNAVVAKRGLAADDGDLIEALRKRVGSPGGRRAPLTVDFAATMAQPHFHTVCKKFVPKLER